MMMKMNAENLRRWLFDLEDQSMTVAELREVLFNFDDQKVELSDLDAKSINENRRA